MKKINIFLIFCAVVLLFIGTSLVVASQIVEQGDIIQLNEEIACWNYPSDTDSTDGKITYLYGVSALTNPAGDIIQQNGPTQLYSQYYIGETTFNANDVGVYKFDVAILFIEQNYNSSSKQWETTNSGKCPFVVGFPYHTEIEVSYPQPDVLALTNLINQLFQEWLQSLNQ